MDKRIAFQFYKNGKLNGFSEINLHYLLEIIKLCKEHKIELILLNTPLHPYYKGQIPAVYIDKYNEIIGMNKLQVVDFKGVEFDDSCFVPDGDHVSEKGAYIASKSMVGYKW